MKKALGILCAFAALTFASCVNDTSETDSSEITIVTDFPNGTTVWEGSTKFYSDENGGWQSEPDGFIQVAFVGVSEGDQILITHEENDSWNDDGSVFEMTGYGWASQHFTFDSGVTNGTVSAWQSGEYAGNKYVKPYTGTQTTAITLSAPDALRLNKAGGITLWGTGFTIKKIVVVSDGVTTDVVLPYSELINRYKMTENENELTLKVSSSSNQIIIYHYSDDIFYERYSGYFGNVNIGSRTGTWEISYADSSSNLLPADVFAAKKTFDVSWTSTTITLTSKSDSTKTYTFIKQY